jgi:hypothetical protein
MITVHTDHGAFNIDAKAEDVSAAGGHLTLKRDGTTIARFREWLSWHETTDQTETD